MAEQRENQQNETVRVLLSRLGYDFSQKEVDNMKERDSPLYRKLIAGLNEFDPEFHKVSKLWKIFVFGRSKGRTHKVAYPLLENGGVKVVGDKLKSSLINKKASQEKITGGSSEEKLFVLINDGKLKTLSIDEAYKTEKIVSNLVCYNEEKKTANYTIEDLTTLLDKPINYIGVIPKSIKTTSARIVYFKERLDQFSEEVCQLVNSEKELDREGKKMDSTKKPKDKKSKKEKKINSSDKKSDKKSKERKEKKKKDKKSKGKKEYREDKKSDKRKRISEKDMEHGKEKKIKLDTPTTIINSDCVITVQDNVLNSEEKCEPVGNDELPYLQKECNEMEIIQNSSQSMNYKNIILTMETDFQVSCNWFDYLNSTISVSS